MPKSTVAGQREHQRVWVQKRRMDWINSQGGLCALCGSVERLEVDHIHPATKSMNPREIWGRREEARLAELAKCQVLCYRCHKVKTVAEGSTAQHGTHERYTSRKCRCDLCRAAHAAKAREYRAAGRRW